MNGYELSREWFNWCFDNPDKISPNHTAMYFFIIEHCNRLGWKEKFGLPTTMVKDAIGIRNFRTYSKTLNDLVSWGFVKMIEKSKNQYSSNIIAIAHFAKAPAKAPAKALDKALQKHSQKHCKSIDSINKQYNKEQGTNKTDENKFSREREVLNSVYPYFDEKTINGLTEKDKEKWLNTIRLLHDKDEFSYDEIKQTIIFGREDDFWKDNFLAIPPLRNKKNGDVTKFQKLNTKMHANGRSNRKTSGKRKQLEEDYSKKDYSGSFYD